MRKINLVISIFLVALLLVNCGSSGKSEETPAQENTQAGAAKAGNAITLEGTGDRQVSGIFVDTDSDGTSDGIDINGDGTADLIFNDATIAALKDNSDVAVLEFYFAGDETNVFYLGQDEATGLFQMYSDPEGQNEANFVVEYGIILGIDTDCDGAPDNTTLAGIIPANQEDGIFFQGARVLPKLLDSLTCNSNLDGQLFYILETSEFQYCNGTAFIAIDLTGPAGANGVDGTPGAPGAPGNDGVDGLQSLIAVTVEEPEPINCPDGGQKIDTGIDDDSNGILDPIEIDNTFIICNGSPWYPGYIRNYTATVSFNMVYVPPKSFPTGIGDSGVDSVTNGYLIGKTEVNVRALGYRLYLGDNRRWWRSQS